MNDTEELTPRQIRVIPYLLGAPSIEEGCKRARVSKVTVYAWLKETSFRAELKRRRDEIIGRALDCLKANIVKASETLVKHLDSDREPISIRAAESIIAQRQGFNNLFWMGDLKGEAQPTNGLSTALTKLKQEPTSLKTSLATRSSCSLNGNEMTRRSVIFFTGLVYLFLAHALWAFEVGILFLEEGVVPRTKVDSLKLHKDPSKNSPFVGVYETKKGCY